MADSPQHVAIIMDGNGRWARSRGLPRSAGHRSSVKVVRKIVEECASAGVRYLTLFAFSSENWRRPPDEVGMLMGLLLDALVREVGDLHRNRRAAALHRRQRFARRGTAAAHARARKQLTAQNQGLVLMVAVAYGGRWDIAQACRSLAAEAVAGTIAPRRSASNRSPQRLQLAGVPDPDLLIRTGGEQRISNFLLWNLAYTELYFTEVLWPEFTVEHFSAALTQFSQRERRFGRISSQLARADA